MKEVHENGIVPGTDAVRSQLADMEDLDTMPSSPSALVKGSMRCSRSIYRSNIPCHSTSTGCSRGGSKVLLASRG